jgi:hypothetical protein
VGTIFNPASVIWCHNSTGAVAYVGRSVLLKVKLAECTKIDPAHIASFRRVSRVRRKPPLRVFGPVTAGSTCCRGCTCVLQPRVASRGHINWKPRFQRKNQFSRKQTVKLIRFDGVCEIELIWATQNIDILVNDTQRHLVAYTQLTAWNSDYTQSVSNLAFTDV